MQYHAEQLSSIYLQHCCIYIFITSENIIKSYKWSTFTISRISLLSFILKSIHREFVQNAETKDCPSSSNLTKLMAWCLCYETVPKVSKHHSIFSDNSGDLSQLSLTIMGIYPHYKNTYLHACLYIYQHMSLLCSFKKSTQQLACCTFAKKTSGMFIVSKQTYLQNKNILSLGGSQSVPTITNLNDKGWEIKT